MGLDYGWEKCLCAVNDLVTSTAPLPERLEQVWTYHLLQVNPDKDLPAALAPEYRALEQAVTREPSVGNEGTLRATIRQMSSAEAAELIQRIVALSYEVNTAWEQAEE